MQENPLVILGCQLRDSILFVSIFLVDSSTLGKADRHSRCRKGVNTRVITCD